MTLHPRKHPKRFPSFPCVSSTTVAAGASPHIGHLTSMGRGSGTALCAAWEGCPRHPSTSLRGSCGAPTFLRQHSLGDMHHLPALSQGSTAPDRRQARQGSAAVGGPAPLLPPPPGLQLTPATAATSHWWPAAVGKSTQFSLSPPTPFLPPVHLLGHTEQQKPCLPQHL